MSFPKQLNLLVDQSSTTTLNGADNAFFKSTATTYTLPAISGLQDGTPVYLKHTGSAGSVIFAPAGSDTVNGGSGTQNVTLTSAGAGVGQGAQIVATKQQGTPFSWWVQVKPQ
jgi:hypothetical protein